MGEQGCAPNPLRVCHGSGRTPPQLCPLPCACPDPPVTRISIGAGPSSSCGLAMYHPRLLKIESRRRRRWARMGVGGPCLCVMLECLCQGRRPDSENRLTGWVGGAKAQEGWTSPSRSGHERSVLASIPHPPRPNVIDSRLYYLTLELLRGLDAGPRWGPFQPTL